MAAMFERYTDRARRAVTLAMQAESDMGHREADTGHLLVGLIGEGGGVAFQALTALGVTPEAVREAVWNRHPGGVAGPVAFLVCTPALKKAFEFALREAMLRGDNFIATEHLLLGLIREGSDVGALALADCGIAEGDRGFLEDMRRKVLELLDGYAKPAEVAAAGARDVDRIGSPPAGPLMCFRCLTSTCGHGGKTRQSSAHGGGMVPALTMHQGTALCYDCAEMAPVF